MLWHEVNAAHGLGVAKHWNKQKTNRDDLQIKQETIAHLIDISANGEATVKRRRVAARAAATTEISGRVCALR